MSRPDSERGAVTEQLHMKCSHHRRVGVALSAARENRKAQQTQDHIRRTLRAMLLRADGGMSQSMYATTRKPSYASSSASGRGLTPMHLDVTSPVGLTAFRAGPRRDPLSRELHVQLGGHVKNSLTPFTRNTFGQAALIPSGWHGSWETDVSLHTHREPLQASVGGMGGLLGSGAAGAAHPNLGVLGSYGGGGPPRDASPHFARHAASSTEEQNRLFLLTGERSRKHADQRWQRTNTLGQYIEVPLMAAQPSPRQQLPPLQTPLHQLPSKATPAAPGRNSGRSVTWGPTIESP